MTEPIAPESTGPFDYRFLMRRNSDGLMLWTHTSLDYGWTEEDADQCVLFQWLENNWSCDCNRELDFCRALGYEPDREDVGYCLGEGQYDLLRILKHDGSVLYNQETDDE